jgi:hypothetical protein
VLSTKERENRSLGKEFTMEEIRAFMITDCIDNEPNGDPVIPYRRHVKEAPYSDIMGGPGDPLVEAKMWVLGRAQEIVSAINWDHPSMDDVESVTFRIYRDGKLAWRSSLEDIMKKMFAIF